MTENPGIFQRLARFFRRGNGSDGDISLDPPRSTAIERRSIIPRPWRRNTAAIERLQEGFNSLTDLMTTIRDNLQSQGQRQEETNSHLSTLPRLMDTLPESNRIHGETLQAIHQQLVRQSQQQETLGAILRKLSDTGGDQRKILEILKDRLEAISEQDRAMASSLNMVGAAMETVSKNSQTSASVLGQLQENIKSRDNELQIIIQRQAERFTILLCIAIFIAIAALFAVSLIGYQILRKG